MTKEIDNDMQFRVRRIQNGYLFLRGRDTTYYATPEEALEGLQEEFRRTFGLEKADPANYAGS